MLMHRPNLLDVRCSVMFALDIVQAMDCLAHVNGIIKSFEQYKVHT